MSAIVSPDDLILLTGASGFIGLRVLDHLLARGYENVRCLVRPSAEVRPIAQVLRRHAGGARVDVMTGNLLSPDDCARAAHDATLIYHLAAGRADMFADAFMNSVVTTRNLLQATLGYNRLRRFVNVSSFSVYSNRQKRRRRLLDESCPIEPEPARRGDPYMYGKAKQDEIVAEYGSKAGIPYVIVRPGYVYGPGHEAISNRVGISTFGIFLHLGGSNTLPFTYVDNCADAIVLAGLTPGVDGEVFNVVDDDLPSSRRFLRLYKTHVNAFRSIYLPHAASYLLCRLWEWYSDWSHGQLPPVFNGRCWHAFWKKTRYSNSKVKLRLGWKPAVLPDDAMQRYFAACRTKLPMLRVAIVGCGKIADAHAAQIQRLPGCEIVGVCDREPLMARQLAERFAVEQHFSDLATLLKEARPDVAHVTTPPQSHFSLAKRCLEQGCHVYVEKPFTLYRHEAEDLIDFADARNLLLTAGHDDQFRPAARRMRHLVRHGYLGGSPLHMESVYCYSDIADSGPYARALLGNRDHWVRALPGRLLHNVISHGIASIAEFLPTPAPRVIAHGFVSPSLKSAGEHEIVDELRVLVSDDRAVTAYFTFSSQIRPSLHQFRLYGAANGLLLDQDTQTLVRLTGKRYKSYAEPFLSPLVLAREYVGETYRNVKTFLGRDFHMKAGLKCLIESFYRSIAHGDPPPIPYREIILTAQIMDDIFSQLSTAAPLDHATSRSSL